MSLYDYRKSQELERADYPFYALIMAAMRKADSDNIELLQGAFYETWLELNERYNNPYGLSNSELSYAEGVWATFNGRKVIYTYTDGETGEPRTATGDVVSINHMGTVFVRFYPDTEDDPTPCDPRDLTLIEE